jgi:hypothetical protein
MCWIKYKLDLFFRLIPKNYNEGSFSLLGKSFILKGYFIIIIKKFLSDKDLINFC